MRYGPNEVVQHDKGIHPLTHDFVEYYESSVVPSLALPPRPPPGQCQFLAFTTTTSGILAFCGKTADKHPCVPPMIDGEV